MIEHEISERYLHLPSSEFAEIMRIAAEGLGQWREEGG